MKKPSLKIPGLRQSRLKGKSDADASDTPPNIEKDRSAKRGFRKKKEAEASASSDDAPLLAGQDAYIALGNEAPAGMMPIATRRPHSPLNKNFYKKDGPRIRVFLDESLQGRYSKVRLSVDAYLRLGGWRSLQIKRPYILLGGNSSDAGVNLEILVFRSGEVIETNEKLLPPSDALDHLDIAEAAIESVRARYPDCVVEQAGPLHRLPSPHINKYHGNRIFRGLRTVSLTASEQSKRDFLAPAGIVAVAMGYMIFTLTSGLTSYQAAVSQAESLEKRLSSLSTQARSIDVMEARQQFKNSMEQEGQEKKYINQVVNIASATQSIKDSEIEMLSVPGEGSGNVAGILKLVVPTQNYPSPLLRGREVLDALAKQLGQPVRLSQKSGITEKNGSITFRIEVLNG